MAIGNWPMSLIIPSIVGGVSKQSKIVKMIGQQKFASNATT